MRSQIWLLIFSFLMVSTPANAAIDPLSNPVYMSGSTELKNRVIFSSPFDATTVVSDLLLTSPQVGSRLLTGEKRSVRELIGKGVDPLLRRWFINQYGSQFTDGRLNNVFGTTGKEALKDFVVFGNFVHGMVDDKTARFYIAVIPKDFTVDKVIFQIQWFGEGAGAHAQIRVKLNTPILLIPQDRDLSGDWATKLIEDTGKGENGNWAHFEPAKSEDEFKTMLGDWKIGNDSKVKPLLIPGDLIYSLYAIRSENGIPSWGPIEGIMGEYANALQFFSTVHKAKDQTSSSFVEQFELPVNQEEARQVIFQNLKFASKTKENEVYNTVFNSCITHALKGARGFNGNIMSGIDINMFNPYRLTQHLMDIDGVKKLEDSMNTEFWGKQLEGRTAINAAVWDKFNSPVMADGSTPNPMFFIVRTQSFDNIVRAITAELVTKKYTYSDVQVLMSSAKEAFELIPALTTAEGIANGLIHGRIQRTVDKSKFSPQFQINYQESVRFVLGKIVEFSQSLTMELTHQGYAEPVKLSQMIEGLWAIRTENGQ